MDKYIEKKVLTLRLLTPVHISDGHEGELIPIEYVIIDSGQLHKIDLSRFIAKIPENRKADLNEYMDKEDIIRIRNFIKLLWEEHSDLFSDCIEYSMNAGDLQEYYINLQSINEASQLIVTPFIRSTGRTFIPGSSIKGAIRTAVINELFNNQIAYDLKSRNINKKAQDLEGKTLNYGYKKHGKDGDYWINDVAKDPFKALKISDTFLPDNKGTIKKVEIIRKTKNGRFNTEGMEDMKIFAEFIEKGTEVDIEIRLDKRYFKSPKSPGKVISIDQVVNSCRSFYAKVLKHEHDKFFKDFDKEIKKSQIADLYNGFLEINNTPNSFLIRLGKHSGRNSLSFNLNNKNGIEPKSRKLIIEENEYFPIGWLYGTLKEA